MPTESGEDFRGKYYRWGKRGKKYYFNPLSAISIAKAKSRADRQGRAIKSNGGLVAF